MQTLFSHSSALALFVLTKIMFLYSQGSSFVFGRLVLFSQSFFYKVLVFYVFTRLFLFIWFSSNVTTFFLEMIRLLLSKLTQCRLAQKYENSAKLNLFHIEYTVFYSLEKKYVFLEFFPKFIWQIGS